MLQIIHIVCTSKIKNCFMKITVLLFCFTTLIGSCDRRDGVDPVPTPALNASLSVSRATVVYDGLSSDSTVIMKWFTVGATNAVINNVAVATSGTKIVTLFDNAAYELKAWNDKGTTTDSRSVTVIVDPQLALLCNGWFKVTRDQYQDTTTKVWYDWEILDLATDDLIKYAPNRKEFWDFGLKREPLQRQYGYGDTVFTLTGAQKNILHMGVIDWKIVSLTQAELIIEGYLPGLFGSPAVYSRETYARVK